MSQTVFVKSRKHLNVIFHVLAWAAVLAFPYLLNVSEVPPVWVVAKRSWVATIFSAAIFYLNYFWLVEALLFRKKRGLFVGVNVLVVVLFFWFTIYIKSLFPSVYSLAALDEAGLSRIARIRELAWYSSIISFILAVVLSTAIKISSRWLKTEADKEKSEKMRLEAELIHLQYQLQPHFFFNSLNNIYALIDQSPEQAKHALHGLGKLMRYLLYETGNEQMRLDAEVDFLQKYIRLMELRLSSNINVTYDFPEDCAGYQVAPLLFIPLIENAFKHGIPATGSSGLFFKMEVNQRQLSFVTTNPNVPKNATDRSGSGIGINNLKKRLELIYPGRHRFTFGVEQDRYLTTLVINFS